MFYYFKKELKQKNLDSLFIDSPQNVFYLTGYNGFSREERDAKILITKEKNYLFTDNRYLGELTHLKNFEPVEISLFKEIVQKNKISSAGFEETSLAFSEYKSLKKIFKKLRPLTGIVERLREIKTENEITYIKKACAIGDAAFKYIIKEIKVNVTEEELEKKLEIFINQNGAGISFRPIVAFGKNSAVPHHQNSKIKLKKGMMVLLDFGVNCKGYCSDMTRTVFFGLPTLKFKQIYHTVLAAQKVAVKTIRESNLRTNDVDKSARQYIADKGFPTIPHSTGHGIGIDVHEPPSLSPKSKSRLKNGMIFSIEPGIYLNGWGGVRIEDLFLFEDNSLKKITHSTSEIISL